MYCFKVCAFDEEFLTRPILPRKAANFFSFFFFFFFNSNQLWGVCAKNEMQYVKLLHNKQTERIEFLCGLLGIHSLSGCLQEDVSAQ